MLRQFQSDLEAANLFEAGCLRGLEIHMEKNQHRHAFSKAYSAEVVHQYRSLRKAARKQKKKGNKTPINVDEGTRRFATGFSRDSRVFARRIADCDAKEALQGGSEYLAANYEKDIMGWEPVCVGKSLHFSVGQEPHNSPVALSA